MTREEAIARLSRYQSETPSEWREKEEAYQTAKSQGWLKYSRKIAIKVAMAMKYQNIARQELTERKECSPQYVSRLLKGEKNCHLRPSASLRKP